MSGKTSPEDNPVKQKKFKALSLVELIMAMAVASILILASGTLLLGGSTAYRRIYTSIHEPIRQDSKTLTVAFKTIGRKANRTNYKVYKIINGSFIEAAPEPGESIAAGQAVEFRYWDEPFYELSRSMKEMDITDTGTHYVLFYLDDDEIRVDYGKVVDGVGAILNKTRQTHNISTQIMARDVDLEENTDIFSHEIIGGAGSGCVMLNATLTNEDGDSIQIKTATLLRVVWPQ
jgi:hypothetical protein